MSEKFPWESAEDTWMLLRIVHPPSELDSTDAEDQQIELVRGSRGPGKVQKAAKVQDESETVPNSYFGDNTKTAKEIQRNKVSHQETNNVIPIDNTISKNEAKGNSVQLSLTSPYTRINLAQVNKAAQQIPSKSSSIRAPKSQQSANNSTPITVKTIPSPNPKHPRRVNQGVGETWSCWNSENLRQNPQNRQNRYDPRSLRIQATGQSAKPALEFPWMEPCIKGVKGKRKRT